MMILEADTESGVPDGIDPTYEAALADMTPGKPLSPVGQIEFVPGAREAADAFADSVGEERGNVRVLAVDWASKLKNGARVELHVRRWRAESVLTLEDLGIQPKSDEEEAALKRKIRLGSGYLLPKDVIDSAARLEDRLRNTLKNASYDTHWGSFVPQGDATCDLCAQSKTLDGTLADHVAAEHADRAAGGQVPNRPGVFYARLNVDYPRGFGKNPKQDVREIVIAGREQGWFYREWKNDTEKIGAQYMALGQRVFDEWDDMVRQVGRDYAIIAFQNYERLRAAGRNDLGDIEAFMQACVSRRLSKLPAKEAVLKSWRFDYDAGFIPLAAMMAQDQANASQILASQDAKTEMQRDIVATAKRELETGVQQFAEECRATLSGLIYDAAIGVLGAIQKNGEVPGASVKQLRNLYEKLKDLKFWDDASLEAQMAEVRGLLFSGTLSDKTPEVKSVMRKLGAEARLVLMELERVPERSGRSVGIPETVAGLTAMIGAGRGRGASNVRTLSLDDVAVTGSGRSAASVPAL